MLQQNTRFFLIAALIFVGSLLYFEWQKDHPIKPSPSAELKTQSASQNANQTQSSSANASKTALSEKEQEELKDIPTVSPAKSTKTVEAVQENQSAANQTAEAQSLVSVKTDVFDVKINPKGGDIVYLRLKKFQNEDKKHLSADDEGFILLDESLRRYYIAQSGLTGPQGPDSKSEGRAKYKVKDTVYELKPEEDRLEVDFTTQTNGVNITKQFVFLRGDYTIGVNYLIDNNTNKEYQANFYGQLKRKIEKEPGSTGFLGMGGVQTFTGAAIYTPDTPYKKITFKDMKNKPLSTDVEGGWAAMLEHYFLSSWIPEAGINYSYQTQFLEPDTYTLGFVGPQIIVPAKTQTTVNAKLYAGPEVPDALGKLSPGLDLTVDYGILWPLCKPIFWLLKKMYLLTHNWGVAIILVTVIIKLLFYRLSASSYRSMGNMRKLQPRMEALKERYGDDKQKFSQAVMELYKKEKINPLGGCLPILVQIPVFIALYYVLLNSVELRQAPFVLWITDLSDKDPYYVLPVLMGISMWVQQKMNPTPPDPVQAKVMMAMPIVFTVLFLNFPSGLVLYWLVNNVLSILQQWFISRSIETKPHGAK